MKLATALSRWVSKKLPKLTAAERHALQAEAAQAMARGKLSRETGEAFLDAVFSETGTCESYEPARTHARRAAETTWGPDL